MRIRATGARNHMRPIDHLDLEGTYQEKHPKPICGRLQATPGAAGFYREGANQRSSYADQITAVVRRYNQQPICSPAGYTPRPPRPLVPPTLANTLFCTIDTSRVREEDKAKAQIANVRQMIEKEIQGNEGMETWRCAAVIKYPKNAERVKIICRREDEILRVKEAAQKLNIPGWRVLRDQLYPVKIDNANRTAILGMDGNVLPGAAEALGKENNVNIAKITWLSKRDSNKAYGSMVVYTTKGTDAKRLLEGSYFDIAGESAYTRAFEPRIGPFQCYNCQEIGHKAFSCKKT
ncbi:hypothetical protein TSTA_008490 [Talaromyces stipitatus ATCC 10500]|uniref:CCHC-type domain-containing protein n=1 Tax=Talaromyces stipitatus (strain ATCC 10500 / CBS 375.48 / QM 6759 / NRRL 1006) TaxID=441959 RepID=B8MV97_TALSN|nr:uncharacterized protein TSTA_008490 [Talaromyces stipitatus ATCC 10500]EED11553.1 hypothetical protein TSTA_008490 [Talaromyces stipitatus ATCC 10500]